jgi:peptidyl-tRNA hydrolase
MKTDVDLVKIIAKNIKNDDDLNINHELVDIEGESVMYENGEHRKEFHIDVIDVKKVMEKNRIKVIYRKNLKMSEGKVAAQVAHAVKNLGTSHVECDIIVLKVSDKKFEELTKEHDCYIQHDLGKTEVDKGTATAAAWFEPK